jgi:hypothetical protein
MVAHVRKDNKNLLGTWLRIEDLPRQSETAEQIGIFEMWFEMRGFGLPCFLNLASRRLQPLPAQAR